jgi:lactoylglutathione lyase
LDGFGGHSYHHTSTRLVRRHEHADHLTGGHAMTKYLHTMIRVSSLEDSIAFFEVLGLREIRRRPDEKGRYTNVFLAASGDEAAAVELTYNWDPEPYTGGRNFGHLAYAVDNIYDTCSAFIACGVTINRPLRDGRMGLHPHAGRHRHRVAAGWRGAAACRTLDQNSQHRFLVDSEAPLALSGSRRRG